MERVRAVGAWDAELFARYRAVAEGPRPMTREDDALERALLGEIVRVNEPLIRHFAARLHGPHIERLGREDVYATARLAFVRAVQSYDPSRGGIAGWFAGRRGKLRDEMERADRMSVVVKGRPRERAPEVEYLGGEDGELAQSEREGRHMARQVRPRIFISEQDGKRLHRETKISRRTIQRYAAGLDVTPANARGLELAMAKLGIARVERREWQGLGARKAGAGVSP
jgi:hypothetical protein